MADRYFIIGVCGRYFSGKTIISNIIARELNIFYIIHTDIIRMLLASIKNDKLLQTPTYMLTAQELKNQFSIVSFYTKSVSETLVRRGEPHIIEGLHFDYSLVEYINRRGFLIYIRNELPLETRINLKRLTRGKLRSTHGNYVDSIINPRETAYYKYSRAIIQIDQVLDQACISRSHFMISISGEKPNSLRDEALRVVSMIKKYTPSLSR